MSPPPSLENVSSHSNLLLVWFNNSIKLLSRAARTIQLGRRCVFTACFMLCPSCSSIFLPLSVSSPCKPLTKLKQLTGSTFFCPDVMGVKKKKKDLLSRGETAGRHVMGKDRLCIRIILHVKGAEGRQWGEGRASVPGTHRLIHICADWLGANCQQGKRPRNLNNSTALQERVPHTTPMGGGYSQVRIRPKHQMTPYGFWASIQAARSK